MTTATRPRAVGNYQLGDRLGEGTFGTVLKGTHLIASERVAIKVLEKKRMQQADDIERVGREIQILKMLKHPNVIRLWEIIYERDKIYLAMEFAPRGELFQHIVKNRRCREPEGRRFFKQLMAGVAYLHSQHVVHRDIKPENLLLDEHKNIRIADFGLSTRCAPGQVLRHSCGSPCYAAPEMLTTKGQHQGYVGHPVDVWSSGVTLFAMLCGFLPFEHTSTNMLYKKIIAGQYAAPPHLSRDAKDVMRRLLTTDPVKRWDIPQILAHPWCTDNGREPPSADPVAGTASQQAAAAAVPPDSNLVARLETQHQFGAAQLMQELAEAKHTPGTACYHLLLQRERKQHNDPLAATTLKPDGRPAVPPVRMSAVRGADASARAPLSDRTTGYGRQPAAAATSTRQVVSAREKGYGYGQHATNKENATNAPAAHNHQLAEPKADAKRAAAATGTAPQNYQSPRLNRSPAAKPSVPLRPYAPASSPELPSPQPPPLSGAPVGAAHAAARAAPSKHTSAIPGPAAEAEVPYAMLLQMHAAHRRRALAEQQAAARTSWRPAATAASPRDGAPPLAPRPPSAKAPTATGVPPSGTVRGGAALSSAARAPHAYADRSHHHNHPNHHHNHAGAADGLGRRPPVPSRHGADLRARKYAAAQAARDAARPSTGGTVAWAR